MKKKKILTSEEIRHLAKLANLKLTEEEIKKYQKQLSDVIDYIKKLNKIDTQDIEPVAQLTELTNVYSGDKVSNKRGLRQEDALKNAKDKKNGFFRVKAIF